MIKITKSKLKYDGTGIATKEELIDDTINHISDVANGLELFRKMLKHRLGNHDFDKITDIDVFYSDFKSGFRKTDWWENHRSISRHHITTHNPPLNDVNLIDVLEMLTDCVMAGMARSGKVYKINLPDDILRLAFDNTVNLLIDQIKIEE